MLIVIKSKMRCAETLRYVGKRVIDRSVGRPIGLLVPLHVPPDFERPLFTELCRHGG
jgi:hypothetical protein